MKGTIYLLGLPLIDTPQAVECFFKHDKKDLKNRLIELAMGYWQQGDSKPKIKVKEIDADSVLVEAETAVDFSYGTRIKKAIWDKSK